MFVPFSTYTYSPEGWATESPHAYVPVARYTQADLHVDIRGATNIMATPNGWLYIANAARNNVLVYDENMRLVRVLDEYSDPVDGSVQQFNGPEGVFIHERTGNIYVAEIGNRRVLEFSSDFSPIRSINGPESEVLPEGFVFMPSDLVLDTVGRMFILVRNNLMGLVQMDSAGEFIGFFGAQQVRRNAFDVIREFFMTDEQRERMVQNVPRQYNNLAIDDNNFIWLTTNSIPRDQLNGATMQRSRDSSLMPVRRMNMNGNDVLVRSGAFPPTGDVVGYVIQPSAFVDIALRGGNLYAVLDRERNKVFTYDYSGNLLYAFGGSGMQRGVFSQASAITYRGTDLLILDTNLGTITVFERTAYGTLLEAALEAEQKRDFDGAYSLWAAVLRQNNNFDMAYTGIARMMMRQGDYAGAMKSYRFASDIPGYSRAFGELRREWIRDFYWVIPLGLILLIAGIAKFFIFANKTNSKNYYEFKRYHLGHEILFAFHTLFHPIGGFWDLKRENRGSMRAAHIILAFVIFCFIFSAINTGYIFNQRSHTELNLLQEIMNVLLPVLMWCTASWALTTLFDGQARLRDIYMVTCYALLPLALTYIPAMLLSNVLVLEETMFISFVRNLGAVWSVLLIFAGTMTLQEYGLVKNFVTSAASLVVMGGELFIGMLFILLGNSLWQFITGVYQEIALRM
jgi:tetratricopeptide (TPR) repeat protein